MTPATIMLSVSSSLQLPLQLGQQVEASRGVRPSTSTSARRSTMRCESGVNIVICMDGSVRPSQPRGPAGSRRVRAA